MRQKRGQQLERQQEQVQERQQEREQQELLLSYRKQPRQRQQ